MYDDWLSFDGNFAGSPATAPQSLSWNDTLKGVFSTGVSALIDAQIQKTAVNDPVYRTGGQAAKAAQAAAPVAMWVAAAAAVALLYIALRK